MEIPNGALALFRGERNDVEMLVVSVDSLYRGREQSRKREGKKERTLSGIYKFKIAQANQALN